MANCPNCSKSVDKKWSFCAYCGIQIPKSKMKNIFSMGMEDVFDKMFSEIHEQMFQAFSSQPKYETKQKFTAPNIKGFSIKISSGNSGAPHINVQELGNQPKNYRHMIPMQAQPMKHAVPRTTVEPKAEVQKLPGKQFIDIELPGVKSDDVEITEGEESVEVRAYKGDTMFFKIIQIENGQVVQNKEFRNGKLHLEVGRE